MLPLLEQKKDVDLKEDDQMGTIEIEAKGNSTMTRKSPDRLRLSKARWKSCGLAIP